MNSKILFTFVLVVNFCIITVTAQVYTYGVFIKTSGDFDSHEGKLMLSVMRDDTNGITHEDFLLTPNDIEIKKDKAYEAIIFSNAPIDNITSIYLRWTLAEPYNPYYAVISMYKSLFPSRNYSNKHMDGATFYPHGTATAWQNYEDDANVTVLDALCYTW